MARKRVLTPFIPRASGEVIDAVKESATKSPESTSPQKATPAQSRASGEVIGVNSRDAVAVKRGLCKRPLKNGLELHAEAEEDIHSGKVDPVTAPVLATEVDGDLVTRLVVLGSDVVVGHINEEAHVLVPR